MTVESESGGFETGGRKAARGEKGEDAMKRLRLKEVRREDPERVKRERQEKSKTSDQHSARCAFLGLHVFSPSRFSQIQASEPCSSGCPLVIIVIGVVMFQHAELAPNHTLANDRPTWERGNSKRRLSLSLHILIQAFSRPKGWTDRAPKKTYLGRTRLWATTTPSKPRPTSVDIAPQCAYVESSFGALPPLVFSQDAASATSFRAPLSSCNDPLSFARLPASFLPNPPPLEDPFSALRDLSL